MKHPFISAFAVLGLVAALAGCSSGSSEATINDSNTPLHLLQPDYNIPYGVPDVKEVKADLDRVLAFLDKNTPMAVKEDGYLERGAFRLASYEWGVTYSAMLRAGETTGDKAFTDYTVLRHSFLAEQAPRWTQVLKEGGRVDAQMSQVVNPKVLDDAGAV